MLASVGVENPSPPDLGVSSMDLAIDQLDVEHRLRMANLSPPDLGVASIDLAKS